ncbi:MAG: hypothetical protein ACTSQU_16685 [Promethearchaeota archaeon]
MIYLETEGSAYERGKIHGETLKKHIPRMMFEQITRHFGFTSYALFAKDILDTTNFLSAAKKWTPDLIDLLFHNKNACDVISPHGRNQ